MLMTSFTKLDLVFSFKLITYGSFSSLLLRHLLTLELYLLHRIGCAQQPVFNKLLQYNSNKGTWGSLIEINGAIGGW